MVDTNLKISIVVPVYKVEKFLHRCIKSVLNQTYSNWELILVDDGSPDTCGKICDNYAEKDKRIQVVHQKNQGVSVARNIGIDVCSGDYLYFVDADDYIKENTLEIMMKTAQDGAYDIVMSGHYRVEQDGRIKKQSENWEASDDIDKLRRMLLVNRLPSFVWGKLYKKACWGNIRFHEGMLFEDFYTVIQPFMKATSACLITRPLYFYSHENENSIMTVFSIKTYIKKRYDWFLGWKEHEEISAKNYSQCVEICTKEAIHKVVRALMLDYGLNVLDSEQKSIALNYLKRHEIPVKYKIGVFILLHDMGWLLRLSGNIQRAILNKQHT